ncbi:MAG: PilN domain-containing protein [Candidatus Magasanikbacteria bacterium]|nr:PilN domain-containing protein [Candidatus Magasanikbacteria bacterium]
MTDFHLNLLSPAKKIRLKSLIRDIFIVEILEMITFTVALLGISQILGWLILTGFTTDLAISTTAINSDYTRNNQAITRVNAMIKSLKNASDDFVPLTPYVLELAENLPTGVYLNGVSINRYDRTVRISGIAKTREKLLSYQNVLEKISWVKNLSIPPSQLLQKDNVGFEIKGQLRDIPNLKKVAAETKGRRPNTGD